MADIPPGNVAVAVRPRRDRFFIVMTGLMLVIVLVGFAHTLYLRVLFDLPEIPAQLYVHGTVLTIWFSLAFVQTWLIATDRTAIHRRLGVAGTIVAVGVVVVSLITLAFRHVPFIEDDPGRAFANLNTLNSFSICVLSALLLRHRPAAHKRLMLFASLNIVLPALDRIGRIKPVTNFSKSVFSTLDMPPEIAFALACAMFLLLAVLIHDLFTEKRIKWATVWAIVVTLLVAPAMSMALINTGIWPNFVHLFM